MLCPRSLFQRRPSAHSAHSAHPAHPLNLGSNSNSNRPTLCLTYIESFPLGSWVSCVQSSARLKMEFLMHELPSWLQNLLPCIFRPGFTWKHYKFGDRPHNTRQIATTACLSTPLYVARYWLVPSASSRVLTLLLRLVRHTTSTLDFGLALRPPPQVVGWHKH